MTSEEPDPYVATGRLRPTPLVLASILAGVAYAGVIYLLTLWSSPARVGVEACFLLGAPLAGPCLASILIDPKGRLGIGLHALIGACVVAGMIAASVVVLREGGVCMVMASPIFLFVGVSGSVITGALLGLGRSRKPAAMLVLLPLIGLPIERATTYPTQRETVVTVRDIAAPPETVWRNILAVRHIQPSETRWTFTQDLVGVPKPIDAHLVGTGVGAVRYAEWGRGLHFKERITGWSEGHDLAWAFQFDPTSIPADIERHVKPNSANLQITDGGYALTPLANGGTRLTLRTRYWLKTPINSYCAWWGQLFIGDFQDNVLQVVQARSEAAAKMEARPS